MKNRVSKNTSPNKRSRGFSLMEILITLTVLGIVAALTAPAFMSLAPNMELKDAAAELYATLQQAKVHAIRTNRQVGVHIGTDGYTMGEPFTDANGDGLYTAAEAFTDTNGDAVYTAVKVVNFANDYDYGIRQGYGSTPPANDWDGNALVQLDDIQFNSRGLATLNPVPTAAPITLPRFYLQHNAKPPENVFCYAVEVRVAGSLNTRKYNGASW